MIGAEINRLVNAYGALRDRQFAVYNKCAKRYGLTVYELFVLDILWFAPDGCTQKAICERLSSNKQTIAAIVGRFMKCGYVAAEEVAEDRRNKRIVLTAEGRAYAQNIIPPAARAENLALERLGLNDAQDLVRLTIEFTENMESEFSEITEA